MKDLICFLFVVAVIVGIGFLILCPLSPIGPKSTELCPCSTAEESPCGTEKECPKD